MGKNRQKQFRLWAITLFISGFLSFIQLALANFAGAFQPAHVSSVSAFSAFVFPNPAQGTSRPTLVVEPGTADKITARIYDPSGSVIFQTRVDEHPLSTFSNSLTYEVPLTSSLRPGVYVGVVLGYQGESVSNRSIVRFAVVK